VSGEKYGFHSAGLDIYFSGNDRGDYLQKKKIEKFSKTDNEEKTIANIVLPLQPGKYQIFVDADSSLPIPYDLNIRENTEFSMTKNITLDSQRYVDIEFEGVWMRGNALQQDIRFKGCGQKGEYMDFSAPHKLVVTVPNMVKLWVANRRKKFFRKINYTENFDSPENISIVLRRTSGETQVFCKRERQGRDGRGEWPGNAIDAFLAPGEYEIYITGKDYYVGQYEVRIIANK